MAKKTVYVVVSTQGSIEEQSTLTTHGAFSNKINARAMMFTAAKLYRRNLFESGGWNNAELTEYFDDYCVLGDMAVDFCDESGDREFHVIVNKEEIL